MEKGITRIPIEDSIPDEDPLPEEEEEPLEFTPEESSSIEFLHEDPSPVEIFQPEPSFEPDSPIDFLKHVWFPPVTCSGATQQQHKEEPVNEVCTDKCDPLPMPVHSPSVVVEEAPLECTPSVFMKNRIKHVKRSDIKIDKDVRFLSPSAVIRSKLTATSYEGKSPEVVKAMKDREKQLREKQIRALMEKKEREITTAINEEKKEEAKKVYGKKLDDWSCDISGEKKNIRTLLTTVLSWRECEE